MKGLKYIGILLTFCLTTISCEREDETRYPVQGTGRPIVFNVESEWPEICKSAIKDMDDLKNAGFDILATWHKDPDDSWYHEYDSYPVFGPSGSPVLYQNESWVCTNEQEWQTGYYNFAAVAPASEFECRQSSSFLKSKNEDNTKVDYTNILTLDLGDDGFSLSTTDKTKSDQVDLMYAFYNENNSTDEASAVKLDFNHAFALLNIRLGTKNGLSFASQQIFVTKVLLYGIHDTIHGDLKFRQEMTINNGTQTEVVSTNIKDLLHNASVSMQHNPFYFAQYSSGAGGFKYGDSTINLVEGLLVFPETLSNDTPLKIVIEVSHSNVRKEVSVEIKSGEWTAGSTNTYALVVDPGIFDEP